MIIGFTGTREGMTSAQGVGVASVLGEANEDDEFHFGDCIGADAQAFEIAEMLGMFTVAHPPSNASLRANKRAQIVAPAQEYLARNKSIVDACDVLIAAPRSRVEEIRGSGTWWCVRYARKRGKRIFIVYPDGKIEEENNGECS